MFPALWQVPLGSRSLRVSVPQIQVRLRVLSWSRGPRARAAGGSFHTGAILKALSASGFSGSLPTGGHAQAPTARWLFILSSVLLHKL